MRGGALLVAALALGCGTEAPSAAPEGAAPPRALETRIDAAVERIESDTCFAEDDGSRCEWANYEIGPRQFRMAASTGEAVLVIDDFGAGFYPELLRYRNRLLGYYRVQGDALEAQVLSVPVPKRLGDVLVSFAGPDFIPARALTRVAAAAGAAYGKLNLLYYGHGGLVFAHLADLVPEQPLVLLELGDFLALPSAVCLGIDESSLALVGAHFGALALALKQVISEHSVRFVNASFGSTVPNLATEWTRVCGTDAPANEALEQLLHAYAPIYDVLFDTDGVVTAQAAANLGSPEEYPFDQARARYASRVRVGFFSSLDSGLDDTGRGSVKKIDQFPSEGEADVFLNWGCELAGTEPACAVTHYEFVGPFGLGVATVPFMSSSYVTPLAVGRLVNLRSTRHRGEPLTAALVQALRQELTPSHCGDDAAAPCVYQDPLAHRQLEPFRLGYQ